MVCEFCPIRSPECRGVVCGGQCVTGGQSEAWNAWGLCYFGQSERRCAGLVCDEQCREDGRPIGSPAFKGLCAILANQKRGMQALCVILDCGGVTKWCLGTRWEAVVPVTGVVIVPVLALVGCMRCIGSISLLIGWSMCLAYPSALLPF